ncbi:sortase [[Clostridium] spiroforme]|nr:sortase [Thomasclavelia spiroformis]
MKGKTTKNKNIVILIILMLFGSACCFGLSFQNVNSIKNQENNTITIPYVCHNAILSVGSTQKDVDENDVCILTEANNSNFGEKKPVLLAGHNSRSLKKLYKAKKDDIISVKYLERQYNYKIIYSNECIYDIHALYDIDTKQSMLDLYASEELIYIYTCYKNNVWLVKAIRV